MVVYVWIDLSKYYQLSVNYYMVTEITLSFLYTLKNGHSNECYEFAVATEYKLVSATTRGITVNHTHASECACAQYKACSCMMSHAPKR